MTLTQRGPWQTVTSREVYRNPWIRVREDRVIRPNGSHGIYGVVELAPAVAVVALTAGEDIYLVGQHRYATDQYSWEVPAGAARAPEEDLLAAAQRELREETGLKAKRWTRLGHVYPSNSATDGLMQLFLAQELTEGQAVPDETEQFAHKVVPLTAALRLVQESEINDGPTVMAVYRAWHHLHG